jgi:NADH-quinone oxidoreductase subunit M
MLLTLFIIPTVTLSILIIIWGYYKWNSQLHTKSNVVNDELSRLLKNITIVSLFITLFYSIYLWKTFPQVINDWVLYPSAIKIGNINLFEVSNNLSLPLIMLSSFVLIISVLTAWHSRVNMLLFCSLMVLLELFLVGAFSCTNLFMFLLFFEASALPIFILIIYCGSARRERIKAGYYFLFFTFYGSLSLLIVILNFYSLSQIDFLLPYVDQSSNGVMWLLLFIAFAVKIPLFPFHIW